MIKIGITQGDINSVNYEVILKTFETEEMLSLCTPIVYGSPKIATYHRKSIDSQITFNGTQSAEEIKRGALNVVNCFGEEEQKIELGNATEEAGKAAYVSLKKAVEDLKNGVIDALVTMPMNDQIVKLEGETFAGQDEYIQEMLGEGRRSMPVLISENFRVALATTKLPISKLSSSISRELLAEKIIVAHNTLKRDFFIDNPRIAILSLNPQYNAENECAEEKETIVPVIDELFKRGVRCFGPYAADEHFGTGNFQHFDTTLAMYYDQGNAPFKALAMNDGLCLTAGMPAVITSPDNGLDYVNAGKGIADESSFRHAIYTAIDIVRNRTRFDNERRNPLKKQYFEKRDDSDKLKLDQED